MAKQTENQNGKAGEQMFVQADGKSIDLVYREEQTQPVDTDSDQVNPNDSIETKEQQVEIVVVKTFRDKNDHKTRYKPGTELVFDRERADDVVKRGLAKLKDNE